MDCVAKLFAALQASNNRIRLNDFLNQCCALVSVLESILLILVVKIVLQHNRMHSGHSSALALNGSVANDPKRTWSVRRSTCDNVGLCGGQGAILLYRDLLVCAVWLRSNAAALCSGGES
jgi:hypothetical protein